jgi:hypothetical protein
MLDVCNEYSRKWCFRFNAKKSYILQFSLNPREKNLIYNWHIGDDKIPSSDNCCHFGIEMNSRFKATERTTNACRKGRNAFFAINGIMSNSTKPCVLVKLYKSVVLPTVLYGYEMWNNLKSIDFTNLNRFQHFIVKRIQNLRTCTRSDMCQSLLGIHPISSYIDTRKLLFLQKLCSLDDNFLTKRIFMTRLFSYFADNSRKHFGFIPDIIEILYHYELSDYLVEYLLEGSFRPKQLWKSIVYGAINETHANEWSLRISSDNDFIRFRNIHRSVELANVWTYSNCSRDIKNSFLLRNL